MNYFLFIVMVFSFIGHSQGNDKVILYLKSEGTQDRRSEYFVQLLKMALEKTETELNKVKLESTIKMQQGRAVQQLLVGKNIDIIWTVTSISREEKLLPIRIPLLKGLLGHRVLIIRKEDKNKFSSVTNLNDLKQFTAGQGHDWPDTEILRANQLDVTTASNYEGLFAMLEARRFDYFPRGVNEAWQELEVQKKSNLIVDDHILLYYPSPIYFFVNNNNHMLASRIEKGLILSIEDGSFDLLFDSYHEYEKVFATKLHRQRKVLQLHNPLLPPLTPLKSKKLWYPLN